MRNRLASPLLLSCLAACAARPYPAYAIENDAEAVSNVVVSDGSLQDVVRIGRALVERQSEGLRVIVPVRNIDSEAIEVLAQISFRDGDLRPVGDTSNRRAVLIDAGSTVDMEWFSLSNDAADYTLRLSWNK